eukprot:GHRQ01028747.1.p1 GENE.GHRQ01028747.1~~GHRQ01028747.1.p1  ORF type:complete len:161 (+),score=29.71 GHRQ01028747.1:136-618(+)
MSPVGSNRNSGTCSANMYSTFTSVSNRAADPDTTSVFSSACKGWWQCRAAQTRSTMAHGQWQLTTRRISCQRLAAGSAACACCSRVKELAFEKPCAFMTCNTSVVHAELTCLPEETYPCNRYTTTDASSAIMPAYAPQTQTVSASCCWLLFITQPASHIR